MSVIELGLGVLPVLLEPDETKHDQELGYHDVMRGSPDAVVCEENPSQRTLVQTADGTLDGDRVTLPVCLDPAERGHYLETTEAVRAERISEGRLESLLVSPGHGLLQSRWLK